MSIEEEDAEARLERLLVEQREVGHRRVRALAGGLRLERERLAEALVEAKRLRQFGEKVNAIRNSIVGSQSLNWSEHAYPLVAALNEAGFEGADYPTARANVGTLIQRAMKAEAEIEQMKADHLAALESLRERCAEAAATWPAAEPDRAILRDRVRAVPLEVKP